MQLWHRHVRDTMVILEEGNLPHPQSSLCDMLVLWKALDGTHRCTEQCNQGEERKRRKLAAEEEKEVIDRDFSAYWRPLETATSFKYLGQVILAADNDWLAVMNNLSWARKVWSRIPGIISREGAARRVSRFFFKSVVQAVLIFGADTWLVTPPHGKGPGGVSDPGGETDDGMAPTEETGQEVDIHLGSGGKGGGGILDDGGVYQAAAEHGRTVHR